jgi:hypothetical protein
MTEAQRTGISQLLGIEFLNLDVVANKQRLNLIILNWTQVILPEDKRLIYI